MSHFEKESINLPAHPSEVGEGLGVSADGIGVSERKSTCMAAFFVGPVGELRKLLDGLRGLH